MFASLWHVGKGVARGRFVCQMAEGLAQGRFVCQLDGKGMARDGKGVARGRFVCQQIAKQMVRAWQGDA